jgi:hypothetical protein
LKDRQKPRHRHRVLSSIVETCLVSFVAEAVYLEVGGLVREGCQGMGGKIVTVIIDICTYGICCIEAK